MLSPVQHLKTCSWKPLDWLTSWVPCGLLEETIKSSSVDRLDVECGLCEVEGRILISRLYFVEQF